jgi:hypothetical protein
MNPGHNGSKGLKKKKEGLANKHWTKIEREKK